jgi:dihydroorotate dehydrogenase
MMNLYPLVQKLLFRLDAETAHRLSLRALDLLYQLHLTALVVRTPKRLAEPVKLMGIEFPNRVGLAAGLDKNGEHINALAACGFGFIEIGTVTPKPQAGNDKPRLFRLRKDRAIINRMGFNNHGVDHLVAQVKGSKRSCILGINIGRNKLTANEQAVDDYLYCLQKVYPHADYVTINISSPNTPGLRELQHGNALYDLLLRLKQEQEVLHQQYVYYVPLLVKIAPDLSDAEIAALAKVFIELGIDGVIATNTTNDRSGLQDTSLAAEQGGLSGQPLTALADHVLSELVKELHGQLPVIAVGGIMSLADAQRKRDLGAALVQVYTGFIYQGPALVAELAEGLA